MATKDIQELINKAEEIEFEEHEPLPLRKKSTEPASFPIDSLSITLQKAILGLHDTIKAPIPLCAQSILATANLATQAHGNIKLLHGQVKPISCYFLTTAESGERKTTCDGEAMRSIKEHEKELYNLYKQEDRKWKQQHEIWKNQKEAIIKSKNKGYSKENKEKDLEMLGDEPQAPLKPILIFSEPTFAGLCKLMQNGYPSLGLFSSEGGQFVGGHSMKEEDKLSTATGISSIWDGEPVKRIRQGDGASTILGKRLSIHLMLQPVIARKFLADCSLQGQGLFSRFLMAVPKSTAGTRFINNKLNHENLSPLEAFHNRIKYILTKPLPTQEGSRNELEPKTITLSEEAKSLLIAFANHIEEHLAPDAKLVDIKEFASKLPEHAARLAATIALFEDIDVCKLEGKHMETGIKLAEYYAEEALRLNNEGFISPDILLAERLLYWLHNNWKENYISLPDIYQRSLYTIKSKLQAQKMASILEEHGWLVRADDPVEIKGQLRRKDVWRIVKKNGRKK